MSEHEHDWKRPDGAYVVIDTYPEQHPYYCECGAFTHDPETGEPCRTCAPEDYERRASRRVVLRGGPSRFDGAVIAEPGQSAIYYRDDDAEKRIQRLAVYERDVDDAAVYAFAGFAYSRPFVAIERSPIEGEAS